MHGHHHPLRFHLMQRAVNLNTVLYEVDVGTGHAFNAALYAPTIRKVNSDVDTKAWFSTKSVHTDHRQTTPGNYHLNLRIGRTPQSRSYQSPLPGTQLPPHRTQYLF